MWEKRHYEKLAELIRREAQISNSPDRAAIGYVAIALADEFEKDSGAFDRARFLRAAGFPGLVEVEE